MRRRDFVIQGTLADLGTWLTRRGNRVKAVLTRYGTAKYDDARYGR